MISQSCYPSDPRVRRQAEKLQADGYKVNIICLRNPIEQPEESFGLITAYRVFQLRSQESLLGYLYVSFSFFLKSLIKLLSLSIRNKFDLIQIHNMPDFLVFVGILQKLKKTPIILDIHDLTLELFADKWTGKKFSFFIPIIKLAEKTSYSFADKIITVNDTCKKIIIAKGVAPEKVAVVLNTANDSIFKFDGARQFRLITENAKIFYHGTIAHRFGLHIAINAMPAIIEKLPRSVLNIYGKSDKSYKATLNQLIRELKLESNVFFHDPISLEQVYEKIRMSDIGVVPYLFSNYMNLSLSTKTFEYAASGLPVVATKLDSLKTIFGDTGLAFVENINSHSLAEKVVELCLNPELRAEVVEKAYFSIQNISGTIMAQKYLDIIKHTTRN